MKDNSLTINPEREKQKIVSFLKQTFNEQHVENAVIGLSGGIDSTVSFSLLREVLPPEHIFVAHMYYFEPVISSIESVIKSAKIPEANIHVLSIRESVEEIIKLQQIENTEKNKVRIGNIAARMRMIILFDLAKKYNALVCGTENKSENLLSYFTRYGDQASDIEPIEHLYKTQVYQLASYMGVPETIINQDPSAGLWAGQTDEGQFGFTYEEADQVLFLHLEQHLSLDAIEKKGFKEAKKIVQWHQQNLFKHKVPYTIKD